MRFVDNDQRLPICNVLKHWTLLKRGFPSNLTSTSRNLVKLVKYVVVKDDKPVELPLSCGFCFFQQLAPVFSGLTFRITEKFLQFAFCLVVESIDYGYLPLWNIERKFPFPIRFQGSWAYYQDGVKISLYCRNGHARRFSEPHIIGEDAFLPCKKEFYRVFLMRV